MSLELDLINAEELRDSVRNAINTIQMSIAMMNVSEIFCSEHTEAHEKEMLQAIELLKRVEQSTLDTISEIEEDLEDEEDEDE
jgi:hypothetical protein